jgi:phenylpyruvate tautomerase PptA (4-oxalocrotonate tautomerase family)
MPVLKIDTNQDITSQRCKELLHNATELLSTMLDKPKGSIMVSITPNASLMLAGSTEPSAYIELKLFAFPDEGVGEFVKTLTEFVKTEMGVAPDFQFHWFVKMEPSMFGWNGKTC